MDRMSCMMSSKFVLAVIWTLQTPVWCSPFPQSGTAKVSLSGSLPSGVILPGNAGSMGVNGNLTGSGSGSGGAGMKPQSGVSVQYQGNPGNLVPFRDNVLSSGLGVGSAALNAKTQSASRLMDGLSYGLARVPGYVGYGVQSAGRLERAGEQLFKAALDLGVGGMANGMQGLSLGMNMMNGLGNAGMKGLNKVATGSSQILEHILSLGATESGLVNTLVALSRLMSPGQGSFLSGGLNLTSLASAAQYLGIPSSNANLSRILDAAGALQSTLSSAGSSLSSAAGTVNLTAIRQAAGAAAQNLGLNSAWNILASRLAGSSPQLQAAVNSQIPAASASAGIRAPGIQLSAQSPGNGAPGIQLSAQSPGNGALQVGGGGAGGAGGSWMDWLG